VPISEITEVVQAGRIADPETVALLYAIHREINHPY
jgi:hypothetical protein